MPYKNKTKKNLSQNLRREMKRRFLVTEAGGQCAVCGTAYYPLLVFHHLRDKELSLCAASLSLALDKLIPEVNKCALLCQNDHILIHAGIVSFGVLEGKEINIEQEGSEKRFERFKEAYKRVVRGQTLELLFEEATAS